MFRCARRFHKGRKVIREKYEFQPDNEFRILQVIEKCQRKYNISDEEVSRITKEWF